MDEHDGVEEGLPVVEASSDVSSLSTIKPDDVSHFSTDTVYTSLTAYSGANWAKLYFAYYWRVSAGVPVLHCDTWQYQTFDNGRREGNIWIRVVSPNSPGFDEELTRGAIQDGKAHELDKRKEAPIPSRATKIWFDYIFDYGGSSDPKGSASLDVLYVSTPVITAPVNGGSVNRRFTVHGNNGGEPNLVVVKLYNAVGDVHLSDARIELNGSWSADVDFPAGTELTFYAKQTVGNSSAQSLPVTVSLVVADVSILSPKVNDVLRELKPEVFGLGEPGARIGIYESGSGAIEYGSTTVAGSGWITRLNVPLPEREIVLIAAQDIHGIRKWSNSVRVLVQIAPTVPVITAPAANSPQNPSFTLSGTGGKAGATMRVFLDLTQDKVGQAQVAGDAWSVPVNVQPGLCSLVVEQTSSGDTSKRSSERSFKIPPPALTTVNVTQTDTTVKFSGTGHTGATVEITIVSGPDVTAPPGVLVTGGRWEITVTNWPFGSYSLKAIQKVSDNANGWIESLPYTFTVDRVLPDPSDIAYTKDYQPTFSGKGYTGATVKLYNPGGGSFAAPDARVSNSQWSSRASEVWGPVLNREVHIKQFLDGQQSPNWVILKVTIPPLAPVIGQVQEDGLSPKISGTCWSGAVVELTFSDAPATKHPATVTGTNWTFQRGTGFEPDVVTHTVTVTQTAASQTSPAASDTFKVYTPLLQPVITKPAPGSEVGGDMTVEGRNGMAGATMQLRDAQFQRDLGAPKLLTADGEWSIDLTSLEFREYTIDAQQKRYERPSPLSEVLEFEVVLLPPVITRPMEHGDLPRTATLEGWAMPDARVEIWFEGDTEPPLKDIFVGKNGRWKAEVTLPVGAKAIRARQTFEHKTSRDSRPLNYNVVPAAPYIETPALDEHIGRQAVVSGFGIPGDTVTVKLGGAGLKVLGRSPVLEDRTWSVKLEFDQPGGRRGLVAMASCDGFDSADSAERAVVWGTYLPTINAPQAGRWVSDPVHFEGQGKPGNGQVMSWFNLNRVWVHNVAVSASGWHGQAAYRLPPGGNWYVFRQTLTGDEGGATVSDWVDSQRFEILPTPPKA